MTNYEVKCWKKDHKSLFNVDDDNETSFTISADNGRVEIQFEPSFKPNTIVQRLYNSLAKFRPDSIVRAGKCRVLGLEQSIEQIENQFPSLIPMFGNGHGYINGFYITEKRKAELIEILKLIHDYVPFTRENCFDLAEILNKTTAWNHKNISINDNVPCPDFNIKPEELIEALELTSVNSLVAKLDAVTAVNSTLTKQIDLLTEQNSSLNSRVERLEAELIALKESINVSATSERAIKSDTTSFFGMSC